MIKNKFIAYLQAAVGNQYEHYLPVLIKGNFFNLQNNIIWSCYENFSNAIREINSLLNKKANQLTSEEQAIVSIGDIVTKKHGAVSDRINQFVRFCSLQLPFMLDRGDRGFIHFVLSHKDNYFTDDKNNKKDFKKNKDITLPGIILILLPEFFELLLIDIEEKYGRDCLKQAFLNNNNLLRVTLVMAAIKQGTIIESLKKRNIDYSELIGNKGLLLEIEKYIIYYALHNDPQDLIAFYHIVRDKISGVSKNNIFHTLAYAENGGFFFLVFIERLLTTMKADQKQSVAELLWIENQKKQTPLQILIEQEKKDSIESDIATNIAINVLEKFKKNNINLLEFRDANENHLLHYCVDCCLETLVEYIEKNAPNLLLERNNKEMTALHLSLKKKREIFPSFFEKYKQCRDFSYLKADQEGWNILCLCVEWGYLDQFEFYVHQLMEGNQKELLITLLWEVPTDSKEQNVLERFFSQCPVETALRLCTKFPQLNIDLTYQNPLTQKYLLHAVAHRGDEFIDIFKSLFTHFENKSRSDVFNQSLANCIDLRKGMRLANFFYSKTKLSPQPAYYVSDLPSLPGDGMSLISLAATVGNNGVVTIGGDVVRFSNGPGNFRNPAILDSAISNRLPFRAVAPGISHRCMEYGSIFCCISFIAFCVVLGVDAPSDDHKGSWKQVGIDMLRVVVPLCLLSCLLMLCGQYLPARAVLPFWRCFARLFSRNSSENIPLLEQNDASNNVSNGFCG